MEKSRTPWWMWPNLLSLDAPLVAVAWLWMFSKLWYKYPEPAVYWVLAGVVWLVYVFDRLSDAKRSQAAGLPERHQFHWKHRKVLTGLMVVVFVSCVVGFFFEIPFPMLWDWPRRLPGGEDDFLVVRLFWGGITSLFTHGVIVMLLAGCFFSVSRRSEELVDSLTVKNALAALTFAYGTAMGAHFYFLEGPLRMLYSFEVLAFGMLCLMNMNAIELWEREAEEGEDYGMRECLLTLPLLLVGFVALLAARYWEAYQKPFHYSLLVASAALLMLDRFRGVISVRLLRVLADVAMLLPLPIFWFWFKA